MAEKRGWNDQYFYSYPGIKEEKTPCSKCQKYPHHGFGRPSRPPYPGMPPYTRPPRPPYPGMPPHGRPVPPPPRPPIGFRPGRDCGCKGMSDVDSEAFEQWQIDDCINASKRQSSDESNDWYFDDASQTCVEDDLYMGDGNENKKMEQDWLYLKQLYPNPVRRLLRYIDDVLDQLEYENSLMFDSNPDKIAIDQLVKKVIEMIQDNEPELLKSELWLGEQSNSDESDNSPAQNQPQVDSQPRTWCPCSETILYVVVLAEMHHRRWRYLKNNPSDER